VQQTSKVRRAVVPAGRELAIQNHRLGRDECRSNRSILEAAGEVFAVLREQHDVLAFLVELRPVAVELHFMYPAWAGRRILGERRKAGLNEGVRSHYLFLPPRTTRNLRTGTSGGRIVGSRSGKNAPQPSGHLADHVQWGQSPAGRRRRSPSSISGRYLAPSLAS
jgi:hypothetical protein